MSARTAASWLCLSLMAAGLVTGCKRMCGSSNPEYDPDFFGVITGPRGTGGMGGAGGDAGTDGTTRGAGTGAAGGGGAGMGDAGRGAGTGAAGGGGGMGGAGAGAGTGAAGGGGGMGGAGVGAGAGAAGGGGGGGGSMVGVGVPNQPASQNSCIDSWTFSKSVSTTLLSLNDLVYNPVDHRFWFSTNEGVSVVDSDTGQAQSHAMGTWQGLAAHPAGGVWAVNGTQLLHVVPAGSEKPLDLSPTSTRPVLVTDAKGELVWWIDGTRNEFSSFDTKSNSLLETGPRFIGSSGLVDLVLNSDDWLWYLGQASENSGNRTVLGRVKARSFDIREEVVFDNGLAMTSVPIALVSMEPAGVAGGVLATLASQVLVAAVPDVFVRATTPPKTAGASVPIAGKSRKLTPYPNCGAIMTHISPSGLKRLMFDGSVNNITVDLDFAPLHVAIGIQDSAQELAVEDSTNHVLLLFKPSMSLNSM